MKQELVLKLLQGYYFCQKQLKTIIFGIRSNKNKFVEIDIF
jgi:hypothetical protein